MIFTILFYIVTLTMLFISLLKNKDKTKQALHKAWKTFENILPQFLSILMLIGIILSVLKPELISTLLGKESGWLGLASASGVGSVTLIPGFIAFPLASALLKSGAGYSQIAVFISTLMMVGVVTFPLEIKFFGKKATLLRNSRAFIFAISIAIIIGKVLT